MNHELIVPKIQQLEYNQLVQTLEYQHWLSKSYDVDTGKPIYQMTETGGIHYVITCLLLGTKSLFSGPTMNPLVKTQVDLSTNNTYVNYLMTNNIVVKAIGTDGLPKTSLTLYGAKLMFVLTSTAGKSGIPTTLGAKIERGLLKTVNTMARITNGVSKLTNNMSPQSTQSVTTQTKSKSNQSHQKTYRKQQKRKPRNTYDEQPETPSDFARSLASFPKQNRSNWWEI